MKEYGFIRIGTITPKLKVADVEFNTNELIKEIKNATTNKVSIVLTPELSLTGYTCADLFQQNILLEECINNLNKLLEETKNLDIISIIGMPIKHENKLYNTAVVIKEGKILGLIPKSYIPNYKEFYEQRWFASGFELQKNEITLCNQTVPISTNLLFKDSENEDICFGIEICEDLWSPYPPSTNHALNGATIIFNPSASNEIVGKYDYRKNLIKNQSAKTISAYCYASSGINESTTDLVFSGHCLIAENGTILKENKRFTIESNSIYTDIDVQKLMNYRLQNTSYMANTPKENYQEIKITCPDHITTLERNYSEYPFVSTNPITKSQRCEEIIAIQASGLIKRLIHTNIEKTVIGISGGLDSTLAFLVILEAYQRLGITPKNIIGVTMPGFGTTNKTYENACKLVKESGATLKEIPIKDACLVHFKDIELPETDRSITYENSQARERTQILMDIANKENALVIGTGDLSELALGWCTYNGDHMSMYAVNTSIPKTLVRSLVEWKKTTLPKNIETVLESILDTPISPELLPPDEYGKITQITEDKIGPYVLHDFFLYHFFRYGATPEKIFFLAKHTFKNKFSDEEIKKWLIVFLKRFFTQQFKRSCLPDGPKVGTVSLSPRGDLRMPSDASANIWLKKIKKL